MKKLIICAVVLLLLTGIANAQIKIVPGGLNDKTLPVNVHAKTVAFRITGDPNLSPNTHNTKETPLGTPLNFSLRDFDLSNNTRAGSFIAPETGIYHLDVRLNLMLLMMDYNKYLRFTLILVKGSGTIMERMDLMNPQTPFIPDHTLSISTTVLLNAGDVISASYFGTAEQDAGGVRSTASFSGFLVAPFPGPSSGSKTVIK